MRNRRLQSDWLGVTQHRQPGPLADAEAKGWSSPVGHASMLSGAGDRGAAGVGAASGGPRIAGRGGRKPGLGRRALRRLRSSHGAEASDLEVIRARLAGEDRDR